MEVELNVLAALRSLHRGSVFKRRAPEASRTLSALPMGT